MSLNLLPAKKHINPLIFKNQRHHFLLTVHLQNARIVMLVVSNGSLTVNVRATLKCLCKKTAVNLVAFVENQKRLLASVLLVKM